MELNLNIENRADKFLTKELAISKTREILNQTFSQNYKEDKRTKYEKIRNMCIHEIDDIAIKTRVAEMCTLFDKTQKLNLITFSPDYSRYDNDEEFLGYTGEYLSEGEWDTPSGFES